MAQEWNEKRDIRDDTSGDTQGYNAEIESNETNNKRYKHDGDNGTNSRTRIYRNVSLKKKGKEDSVYKYFYIFFNYLA